MKFLVAAQFSILHSNTRSEYNSPVLTHCAMRQVVCCCYVPVTYCTVLTDGSCTVSKDS